MEQEAENGAKGRFKKVVKQIVKDKNVAAQASGYQSPLNFFLKNVKNKEENGVATLDFLKTICDSSKSESNFNREILFS